FLPASRWRTRSQDNRSGSEPRSNGTLVHRVRILHHIALKVRSERQKAEFLEAGFELKDEITSFDIAEDDTRWKSVVPLLLKYKTTDTVSTEFSEFEQSRGRFLRMGARSHHGYPEPSDDMGYLAATFDLTSHCSACGIGKKQMAPFRMKKVPALDRGHLLLANAASGAMGCKIKGR